MEIVFCTKFDPNDYRYYDIGLWTKYRHGIAEDISPRILPIQDGE
jgi:hypothetical protein